MIFIKLRWRPVFPFRRELVSLQAGGLPQTHGGPGWLPMSEGALKGHWPGERGVQRLQKEHLAPRESKISRPHPELWPLHPGPCTDVGTDVIAKPTSGRKPAVAWEGGHRWR